MNKRGYVFQFEFDIGNRRAECHFTPQYDDIEFDVFVGEQRLKKLNENFREGVVDMCYAEIERINERILEDSVC